MVGALPPVTLLITDDLSSRRLATLGRAAFVDQGEGEVRESSSITWLGISLPLSLPPSSSFDRKTRSHRVLSSAKDRRVDPQNSVKKKKFLNPKSDSSEADILLEKGGNPPRAVYRSDFFFFFLLIPSAPPSTSTPPRGELERPLRDKFWQPTNWVKCVVAHAVVVGGWL